MIGSFVIIMLLAPPPAPIQENAQAAAPDQGLTRPQGPPPSAQVTCTPNPVRMGETVTCTLNIVHRKDVSVSVGAPASVTPEPASPSEPHGEGLLKTTRVLTLQNTSMQKLKVDNLTVTWTEASGGQETLTLPSQRIVVQSVLSPENDLSFRTFVTPQVDEDQFWALHGPLPYRVTHWPTVILASSFVVIFFGVVIGVAIKRWLDANKQPPPEPVDPRPAHVIAQDALAQLIAADLPGQNRMDEYYVRLSEIVRAYLDKRFDINALEMTSDEIRTWARTQRFSSKVMAGFDDFLEETDLVKFADFAPSVSQLDTVTRVARGLIVLTQDTSDVENPTSIESMSSEVSA